MQIIKSDFKKGFVKLKVEDIEDLWYLSRIIDVGDLVKGKTTRKIKIGAGENTKTVKKTLTLKVEAEAVEFSKDGFSLRINGKIKEGPEDTPKDSYHTIPLEQGSEFILEKIKWLKYQQQKLNEAAEKKFKYLLCLFDREEALFALTKNFGHDILTKIKGDVPKKEKKTEIKKDFQQEIIKILQTYADRYQPEKIIVASPVFYKEDLFKKISNPDLKKKIVLAACSDVNETAISEVLRRPELKNTLKSSRIRQEKFVVEELLNEINKNHLAAYGWRDVKIATDAGAANKLLLTDDFIQKKRKAGKYQELDGLMKQVDQQKCEIHILNSKNDSGRKLDGLGGIAAILRYKVVF